MYCGDCGHNIKACDMRVTDESHRSCGGPSLCDCPPCGSPRCCQCLGSNKLNKIGIMKSQERMTRLIEIFKFCEGGKGENLNIDRVLEILKNEPSALEEQDSEGNRPLHHYCRIMNQSNEVLEFILKNVEEKRWNTKNRMNETPLAIACIFNQIDLVKTFLNLGGENLMTSSVYLVFSRNKVFRNDDKERRLELFLLLLSESKKFREAFHDRKRSYNLFSTIFSHVSPYLFSNELMNKYFYSQNKKLVKDLVSQCSGTSILLKQFGKFSKSFFAEYLKNLQVIIEVLEYLTSSIFTAKEMVELGYFPEMVREFLGYFTKLSEEKKNHFSQVTYEMFMYCIKNRISIEEEKLDLKNSRAMELISRICSLQEKNRDKEKIFGETEANYFDESLMNGCKLVSRNRIFVPNSHSYATAFVNVPMKKSENYEFLLILHSNGKKEKRFQIGVCENSFAQKKGALFLTNKEKQGSFAKFILNVEEGQEFKITIEKGKLKVGKKKIVSFGRGMKKEDLFFLALGIYKGMEIEIFGTKMWSVRKHKYFSRKFRQMVKTVLLLQMVDNSDLSLVPKDCLFVVFEFVSDF